MRRGLLLLPPLLWLLLFVATPALVLLAIAVAAPDQGVPPFRWPIGWRGNWPIWQGSTEALETLTADGHYAGALLRALLVALETAVLCLALAYPMALGIAVARPARRMTLLLLVLLPFWAGFLPRLGAWVGLLRDGGWVNGLLLWLGLVDAPVRLLYTEPALLLGMVHAYLPFAVLPVYAAIARQDPALAEAAADLGARPGTVFRTVTLPLSLPGVAAGFLLVFIPAAGEYVIPELLGPPEAELIGRAIWTELFQTRDWPVAAALAVALLLALSLPIRLFQRLGTRR